MRNHSFENDFDLHENETACRTHFHMKGFALRLVLKQRHKRTRKWPISPCCSFVNSKFKTILSLTRGNKSNLQVNKRIPKFQPFWNKVFWPTKFLIVPLPIITRITMCNLHWCYTFCTGVTLFTLVLHLNCTALSQSESSIFFMYIIRLKNEQNLHLTQRVSSKTSISGQNRLEC